MLKKIATTTLVLTLCLLAFAKLGVAKEIAFVPVTAEEKAGFEEMEKNGVEEIQEISAGGASGSITTDGDGPAGALIVIGFLAIIAGVAAAGGGA